jgi:hypothetical protein
VDVVSQRAELRDAIAAFVGLPHRLAGSPIRPA